jgi:hypothetical protein
MIFTAFLILYSEQNRCDKIELSVFNNTRIKFTAVSSRFFMVVYSRNKQLIVEFNEHI